MGRISDRKIKEETETFISLWNQFAEIISIVIKDQKITPKTEKEYLLLCGELAQRSVTVAHLLDLDKSFVQKVTDILEDIYNLRILIDWQEFQISLLRERWNAVLLEINSVFTKIPNTR